MSDDFDGEMADRLAAIHAEFDQFRAAIMEIATTVCDYRGQLVKSDLFEREESFMLTMEYQTMVLNVILNGNFGSSDSEVPEFPEFPDFPPDE